MKLILPPMKFKFLIALSVIFLSIVGQCAQTYGQNPFDLSYRQKDSNYKEITKKTHEQNIDTIQYVNTSDNVDTSQHVDTIQFIETPTQNDLEIEEIIYSTDDLRNSETNEDFEPNIINTIFKKNSLIFGVLLILMIILTTIITTNRQISLRVLKSFMNDNFLNLLLREQKGRLNVNYLFLYIFFIVNMGLFFFIIADRLIDLNINITLFTSILFVSLVYLVRHSVMHAIQYIYDVKKEASQYNFTIIIFNIFLSFFLLPINLFSAFSPDYIANIVIYTGLIIIGLIYLFRQLRGFFIAAPFFNDHKFHFFLYLCTVEIAPILIAFKLGNEIIS